MSLVEAVVQRQGVANPTIHLHTVVNNASKRALCVSLGHTHCLSCWGASTAWDVCWTFAGVKSRWTKQLHALLDAPFDAILMPDLPTHPFATQSGKESHHNPGFVSHVQ